MTMTPEHAADLEQLKRALVALRKLRARVDEVEQAGREPIAIVGIGCRLPGGVTEPMAYWELLRTGRDAIAEVPVDRWDNEAYWSSEPDVPGKIPTRFGGFLEGVDQFDPHFFGISPREAASMDPQQRLVLETAWEALEDATIVPGRLAGSNAGVFIGIGLNDYGRLQVPAQAADPTLIDTYMTSGNVLCITANRLSYVLNLHGPSMAIDTACSSSLVAVHQAVRSLRHRECDLALVGGSNVLLAPDISISLNKFLAPDGRCKFGDAQADGYVRGEGVVMLVLVPLRRALAEDLPIYALIRGSAVNQDGYSSGLTVPNGVAQQAMLRAALADARVTAHEVSYVEAHGTGTALGDPIELQALGTVLGVGRPADRPLLVGSVKANIGHLEAGAGIAGLVKAALALKHRVIPPSLHFTQPNPHIAFAQLGVQVPTMARPWPSGDGPRLAGVSSFGFGGTNAHVILEEPPVVAEPEAPSEARPVQLLPLSAREPVALRELAARYATLLARSSVDLADLCAAASRSRTHFAERASFVAATTTELREQLAGFAAGEMPQGVYAGRIDRATTPKVALLFTGQGAQYLGMGRRLYEAEPIVRATLDRCAELLRPELAHDLREVIFGEGSEAAALLDQTAYTQPALFALEYAVAELWRSWGITPAAVLGHSLGEYVAAVVAGVMSLEDGLRLVAARGRLMGSLPAGGAMAAIFATPERVRSALASSGDRVTIAAVNEPEHAVISGQEAAVEVICAAFAAEGVKTRRLVTSHAFHSPLMEPILAAFEQEARSISFRPPRLALGANLTGAVWSNERAPDATYWRRHLREPVQFAAGVQALHQLGCTLFIEVGPAPILAAAGSRCLPDAAAVWVPSLRAGADDLYTMLKALGMLYGAGVSPDWRAVTAGASSRSLALPTYPFQHERYWISLPKRSSGMPMAEQIHPLLDRRLRSPVLAAQVFELALSLERLPLLDGHRVYGTPVFPATAYIEQVLAAVEHAFGPGYAIAEMLVQRPLALTDEMTRTVQVVLRDAEQGVKFEVVSQGATDEPWLTHASGSLLRDLVPTTEPEVTLAAAKAVCPDEISVGMLYDAFVAMGMGYGPAFCGIERVWRGDHAALAMIRLPHVIAGEAGRYRFHPALLDACLQVVGAALPADSDRLYLPISVEGFCFCGRPDAVLWSAIQFGDEAEGAETLATRLHLFDRDGRLVAKADRIVFKRARQAAFAPQPTAVTNWLYEVAWRSMPPAVAADQPGHWLIVGGAGELGERLVGELARADATYTLVTPAATLAQVRVGHWHADLAEPTQVRELVAAVVAMGALRGVVYLADGSANDQRTILGGALNLAQALVEAGAPPLWLVTVGAQAASAAELVEPAAATIWGFARVAAREHPASGFRCIDLDPTDPAGMLPLLVAELLGAGDEDQVALRAGERLAARLVPRQAADVPPVRLEVTKRGTFEGLTLKPVDRPEPGPGEVVIRVYAAGLNFRDVLNVLGMYPGEAGGLGNECAGTVEAVGADVYDVAVGDAVLAIAFDCLGTFAVARAAHTLPKPVGMSFAEAATIPIAFATAAYALRTLADLKAGERVLIHAAAGGVGLAAVQLALRAGAEVIGTAGSPAKRALLTSLGVHHVFDSRSLRFADDIRAATDGAGVDVVLNALSGEFIPASLGVLRDGGRFLEIGKRDIWEPAEVAALGRALVYHIIYLGDVCEREPALVRDLLVQLTNEFAAGTLQPLPLRAFALEDADAALRHMAQARHIGKVVLTPGQQRPLTRADGTYLITGGLGGLGLTVARGLVEAGASNLALVGRRAPSPAAEAAVAELVAAGAEVLVAQADIADEEALGALLTRIDATLPPLRGVIHAAGVLDDGLVAQQTWARAEAVLAPKVAGAEALGRLVAGRDLDWLVFFSAGAALLGTPGQATYAAANAYLDSLAHTLMARGLPALSINWGMWGEVGMAAALGERQRQRLLDQGLRTITPDTGMRLLAAAIATGAPQLAALPVNWSTFGHQFGGNALPSLFRELVDAAPGSRAASSSSADSESLVARLAKTAPGNRQTLLRNVVREHAGRILGLAPATVVDPRQPLGEIGLDSLMAVELRNSLGGAVGRTLPTTLLFDYPTIAALTSFLETVLAPSSQPEVAPVDKAVVIDDRIADLEQLTDEEAEALLLAELDGLREERSDTQS
ncbi:type I polyketide synthase [Candidatus Chloroploca sp. Khr17]|uniref:type I polyketide synthase n=1 Tax=Candidatus Chloroploca sp. Khr17 TaxID=2496869 RepID=UPI00101E2070|nr:type I polyketide synthase [Candidatus Chloroploca sp. Khr17]